ncbi:MAG: hypothetical protein ACK5P7_05095 [Bdellovibrio sp.]|jgi:hypothetical protein
MKQSAFVSILILLTSAAVFAGNGVEREAILGDKSSMPLEVQERLVQVINKSCPQLATLKYTTSVDQVLVDVEDVDQGVQDVTYDIRLITSVMDNSGQLERMKIVLKRYDGSNPAIDWFELLDVQTPAFCQ